MKYPKLTSPLLPESPPSWAEVYGEDRFGVFAGFSLEGVTFLWRWIPPGEFLMGCDEEDEHGYYDEEPQHPVQISKGFWLGETPVTQVQWRAVTGFNPSDFDGDSRPVEQVNWDDSNEFSECLNWMVSGMASHLPTEAQWEYACRAGTQASYHDGSFSEEPFGLDPALDQLGWFDKNSNRETHPVKQKRPNEWGLYDMHGNVWEWCRDGWDEEAYQGRKVGVVDPWTEDGEVADRVIRGGSWANDAGGCRGAYRNRFGPGDRFDDQGLRLAAGHEPVAAEPRDAERPQQE